MTSNETTSTSKTTTTSEFESEEMSIETTVPTDLTLTLSRESDFIPKSANLPERKRLHEQLLRHDLQLVKIELSQKTLVIDNLKADFMARREELEEKLADALYQKKILQARLESQLQIQEDEAKNRLEQTKFELKIILEKQKQLEETNAKLLEKTTEVRQSLRNLELTEKEFHYLQMQDESHMSLRDYVAGKIYEMVWCYKSEQEKLKTLLNRCTDENVQLKQNNSHLIEELDLEKIKCADLQSKYHRTTSELNNLKSQLLTGDHRIENYDKLKIERDKYMEDFLETKKMMSTLQATTITLTKEVDAIKSEKASLQQKLSLLQQDKDFLNKKVVEVSSQFNLTQEHLSKTSLQLEKMTQGREDIYEKYVFARDLYKSEFEKKLQEELEAIQTKTSSEIETLRRRATEINEQELRSLKDSRDLAISQRDKAEMAERQAMNKYEGILEELRQIQSSDTMQLSNLKSQITLKIFELEQTKTILAETQRNLQDSGMEKEKLLKKSEILNNEFHQLEHTTKRRIVELEMELRSKSNELTVYERLENDLDDIVMQAAEVADCDEGEKMVLTFGRSSGMPTSMKRRLQHSFHLAKRILYLEKQIISLKQNLENEKCITKDLTEQTTSLKEMLDYLHKPNTYLINTIRSKDDHIKQQKSTVDKLNEENEKLKNERQQFQIKIAMLTEDIKKLLENRKEIEKMKQSLKTMFPRQLQESNVGQVSSLLPKSSNLKSTKPNLVKKPFRN